MKILDLILSISDAAAWPEWMVHHEARRGVHGQAGEGCRGLLCSMPNEKSRGKSKSKRSVALLVTKAYQASRS
jgi:hypothetical protein